MITVQNKKISPDLQRIIDARHHDPFSVLGRHPVKKKKDVIRTFIPRAKEVRISGSDIELQRIEGTDLFQWSGDASSLPQHYQFAWTDENDHAHATYDPYCFEPQLSDFDLHLFGEGKHWHAYNILGARPTEVDGIAGVLFSTWAPSAQRVSVVGDFNQWDGRYHPMRV
ncbi:1,4-alpha-glucan branching enzyme, partial [Pseudomonadota bacterium]